MRNRLVSFATCNQTPGLVISCVFKFEQATHERQKHRHPSGIGTYLMFRRDRHRSRILSYN